MSEKLIKEAAEAGNIDALYALIRQDPYVLERIDRVPFVDTPLHIAAAAGQDDFAMEIMKLKPSFARKLNKDGYSFLHLALRNEKFVTRFLATDKDLIRIKGREGYTLLHLVAKEGNLRLLAQFLVDCPESIQDVTIRNETALHIAAKHNRLEALKVLAQSLRRSSLYSSSSGKKLLNWKDKDGNTVLHVAASNNRPEMVKLLLDCKVDMNAINSSGKTALDILEAIQVGQDQVANKRAKDILRNAEGLNASSTPRVEPLHRLLGSKITMLERAFGEVFHDIRNMSIERSNAVLVILVLILTSTYQATLSPPGGISQGDNNDNNSGNNLTNSHNVGKSVMSSTSFLLFYIPNTLAFIITLILTLGLLAIIASGITYLLLVPLLLLYFCLLSSTFEISPTSLSVVIFSFLPIISLPLILTTIGHTKSLMKLVK